MRRWRWGTAHVARFRHPLFGWIPVLRDISDIAVEVDGGAYTINRAQTRIGSDEQPYADVHGPGLRAIYDLADLANSRFAIATGQSGNLLSPDYRNATQAWRDGLYIRIVTPRDDARGRLTLVPAP
jgi:penicillin amidase